MKLILILGLLSVLVVSSHSAPHCHLSELWNCVQIAIDWLHSLPPREIPETEDDVEVMCTELTSAMNCAFGFRDNCTTPLQKELISLAVEGTIELNREFCSDGSNLKAKYLAHSVCLNRVSKMDEVKEQIEYILAVLDSAEKVAENEWITYSCCGYAKIMNTFAKLGRENCGQEAVDAANELISVAIAQLPEVVCGGYDGTEEKCTAVLPPDGSKPSGSVKRTMLYQTIRDILKNWLD